MNRNLSLLLLTVMSPLSLLAEESVGKSTEINGGEKPDKTEVKASSKYLGRLDYIWMYEYDDREGLLNGTSRTGTSDVLFPNSGYTLAPKSLHVSQGSLAITHRTENDAIITSVVLPYAKKRMITHNSDVGINRDYLTETSGFGDIELLSMVDVLDDDKENSFYLINSWVLPTGSIEEEGDTPFQLNTPLPFEMQLGTGSFAINPSLMYQHKNNMFDVVGLVGSRFYLNRNDNGYKWGDYYYADLHSRFHVSDWFSVKLGLQYSIVETIDGRDNRITTINDIGSDASKTGGRYLDAMIGILLFKGLSAEFTLPVYHDVNGPQLEKRWQLTAAINF